MSGNELLLGIRENSHVSYMAGQLGRHGLGLRRQLTCADSTKDITDALDCCIERGANIIIITGGLGPTEDDNTREAVASYFGLELVFDEAIKEAIEARFASLGYSMSENNLRQCYVPKGADVIPNPNGTAPGLQITRDGLMIFLLPGPSSELYPMLNQEIIPRLCSTGICNIDDAYLQIRTCGIGESLVETKIHPIVSRYEDLEVSYCAHQGVVDIRLSSESDQYDSRRIREIADECREVLGEDFCSFGHDTLAKVVFDKLRANETTLAIAESCTGGMLSNAFTDIPGASKVFAGGFICYNNDTKIEMLGVPETLIKQHGAVSAECAVAMADGAAERLSTEYALSITGFAGPSGGTPDNPVGTVYIGYHSPVGTWCVKMVRPGGRLTVKQRAVNRALDVMRRKLNKYAVVEAFAAMTTA